ncbi:MAG: hypothetical protein JWM90_2125 [Thermoleophilia bacterium]|nr:hypothetical protein [Thermoleophilia bacterium]
MNNSETTHAYSFSKQTAPKGWSHPLKRSLLDAALKDAGLYESIAAVSFQRAGGRDFYGDDIPLVAVHWWGTAQASYTGMFSLSVSAVAAPERQSVAAALESVLLEVFGWMARTLASPPSWQDANHYACVVLADGHPRFEERS